MDAPIEAPETPVVEAVETEVADQPETPAPSEQETSAEETFTSPPEDLEGMTPEQLLERYKQMQADYTRKRQADAETAKQRQEDLEFIEALRSDPDTQKAVFEQLQELLNESEVDETPEAGTEPDLERQVRELREAQEAREAQELTRNVVSHIEQLAKESGVELDEHDLKDVFDRATSGKQINKAETEAAFKAFKEREEAREKRVIEKYLASKKTATTEVPAGSSATETPDLRNRDERIKRFAAIMEANAT